MVDFDNLVVRRARLESSRPLIDAEAAEEVARQLQI